MSDIFTHGEMIECPICPGVGRSKRKPTLRIQSRNYSGCSVDYGVCPECGRSWCVSYVIKEMVRSPDWDGPSRKQLEKEEEEADMIKKFKKWWANINEDPTTVNTSIIKPCPYCNATAWDFGNYYYTKHLDNCFIRRELYLHTLKKKDTKRIEEYNTRSN